MKRVAYTATPRLDPADSSARARWPRERAHGPHARATLGRRACGSLPRPAARTNGLYSSNSTTSPPALNPTRAIASGGYGTGQSGSGGDAVEAIADLISIARLPPGDDSGVGYGVAMAARQRWHHANRHFGFFGGPLATAND